MASGADTHTQTHTHTHTHTYIRTEVILRNQARACGRRAPSLKIFGNSLISIERGSGQFFKPKEALKMVFGMRSIRVFPQFFVGSLL